MSHRLHISALVAVLLAFAPVAHAAIEDNPAPPAARQGAEDQGAAQSRAAPDDGELSAFVAAFLRMIGVQHGYMMLMRHEQDPGRLEEIKQSALADMKMAVERDGLTVDRYNQIALTVRDDPSLRDRIEGMLQQLATEPDGGPAPAEEE